jgi:hypothetical protein
MKVYPTKDIAECLFSFFWTVSKTMYSSVNVQFHDAQYVLPTKHSVVNDFSKDLFLFLSTSGMYRKFQAQAMDCDDFALIAHSWASVKHNLHMYTRGWRKDIGAGIAFGQVSYVPDGFSLHRANIFFSIEKGKMKIFGYEPQACMIFEFTKKEIASIISIEL